MPICILTGTAVTAPFPSKSALDKLNEVIAAIRRDTGGWGGSGDDANRDEKRRQCTATALAGKATCDAKFTDTTDPDIVAKYRACMKPVKEKLAQCYADNP